CFMLQGINRSRRLSSARLTRSKVALDEPRTKSEDHPTLTGKKSRRLPKLFRIREKAHHPGPDLSSVSSHVGDRIGGWKDVRYSPFTQHERIDAEAANPALVGCAH